MKPEPRVMVVLPSEVEASIRKRGVNTLARQLQAWEPMGEWESYAQKLGRALRRGKIDDVFLDLVEMVLS